MGRLEMCSDGHWGSVCGSFVYEFSWQNKNDLIAAVVCRQLGHAAKG